MAGPRSHPIPVAIPFARWRHFKEAFSPDVVHNAIRSSDIEVRSCIDPFGGSGTTALTCQFAGINPITIEVNPYLADLIEAKLQLYDVDKLVRDLATVLRRADTAIPPICVDTLPPTFVEPGLNNRWIFARAVADRILAIAAACGELDSDSHRRLFRVLLGGTLVSLSNVTVNGKGRRYRGGWNKIKRTGGTVDHLFTASVSAAIGEIRRCAPRISTSYTLIRADSRVAIERVGAFDLAVFSPPYPNSFDYTDVYNIELWMLGYIRGMSENHALRIRTLSSHVQVTRSFAKAPHGSRRLDETIASLESNADRMWNRHIPNMVGAYFAEMLAVVRALASRITPGGRIWIVAGDSSYVGVAINVAHILAELAATLRLSVDRLDTLREMRKSAQQGGQIQLAETLLVLRRS